MSDKNMRVCCTAVSSSLSVSMLLQYWYFGTKKPSSRVNILYRCATAHHSLTCKCSYATHTHRFHRGKKYQQRRESQIKKRWWKRNCRHTQSDKLRYVLSLSAILQFQQFVNFNTFSNKLVFGFIGSMLSLKCNH